MAEEIIRIHGLRKTYRQKQGTLEVLKGIDLDIYRGEVLGIIGLSGAGKSTLVRCINRLETWDSGTVEVAGKDLSTLSEKQLNLERQKIGMIFQQFNLLKSKTVFENVALSLRYKRVPNAELEQRVSHLLELVELTDKRDAYPSQLSGGQKQRVAIARSLASKPDILLSDEATSSLDPQTTTSILKLLLRLKEELHLTVVVITHEMDVIRDICDRVAVIENGEIREIGATEQIFASPQSDIGRTFVSSIIKDDAEEKVLFSPSIVEKLRQGGVLVRVRIGDEGQSELLRRLNSDYELSVEFIYGNVELVNGHPVGNLFAVLSGNLANLNAALQSIDGLTQIMKPEVPQYA